MFGFDSLAWQKVRNAFQDWWDGKRMLVYLTATNPTPGTDYPVPAQPADSRTAWLDPVFRRRQAEAWIARTIYLGDSFPLFDTQIGPGSLSTFLGARPEFVPGTVWYWPCITDPATAAPIRFDPSNNQWWDAHLALIHEGLAHNDGRYLVGIPDLIENLDTLASLRGDTPLLFDLIERPTWVLEKLSEINQAYFEVYDLLYDLVRDETGAALFGPFCLLGQGRTAKLQCDISATLSPKMFLDFVVPSLREQAAWLDHSMYHLDGTTCLQHLDALLALEELDAIEWTPQDGRPGGGSAEWYPLYRRILASGKRLQCVGVRNAEIVPLVDAVGPQGLYIIPSEPRTLAEAEAILKALEPYQTYS